MGTKTENEVENQPAAEADKRNEDTVAKAVSEEAESCEETESDASQLQARLDEAYGKNAELQNNFLRKAADLDNMRKRLARDREEIAANAITGVLEDLLPSLDAFRLGLEATKGKDGAEEVVKGFAMALDQMNEALRRRGLETIDPVGESFDPALHEALSREPSEEIADGAVIGVTRVGYRLNERLLRPAAVIVSTGSAKSVAKDSEPQVE
ncbi:MAG: nucleotide exchange factor GrpE [Opitutales bacterium]|nr:nucleotide exchange factor GrpE [Opitutales bacterium]|tara:strand:- start:251 stop:883 length:633 start_codon:yes stop_codon:yes gene_type:complete